MRRIQSDLKSVTISKHPSNVKTDRRKLELLTIQNSSAHRLVFDSILHHHHQSLSPLYPNSQPKDEILILKDNILTPSQDQYHITKPASSEASRNSRPAIQSRNWKDADQFPDRSRGRLSVFMVGDVKRRGQEIEARSLASNIGDEITQR
ncbi:hypothetical protein BDW72DRAFT_149259 [Aspergillus terricola var. indicus]